MAFSVNMHPVAILFDNFGPYHLARISGAAGQLPVVGIELFRESHDYQWHRDDSCQLWERRVVVDGPNARSVAKQEVAQRLRQVLDECQPSAVAIPGWAGYASHHALAWCRSRGVPAILMSESTEHDEIRKSWKEWVKRRLVALFDAALVGGKPHARYLTSLGMPADLVFEGYDVVDNHYFANGAAEVRRNAEHYRELLGLKFPFILASSRFIEKKNLLSLVRAFSGYVAWARGRANGWRLVILGAGPLLPQLTALIVQLQLGDAVLLPGFRQIGDLPAYYGLADCFVHASTTEQWGLVVNEAMASGLPVLVSNRCGCAEDLVREGINGYTFDPWEMSQLTSRLIELDRRRDCLGELGIASQRLIADWDPRRFGQSLRMAVESAQSGRRRRGWQPLLSDIVLQSCLHYGRG